MGVYLGVKQVKAQAMTRGEYCDSKGWELPDNENGEDEGMQVTYEDGYVSWSPIDVFNKAYRPISELPFGPAIEALKQGKKVARSGWNGKGIFIFMRPSDKLEVNMIVHKVKSLPNSVKGFFGSKTNPNNPDRLDGSDKIDFTAYLCMYAENGSIVNGWLASQTDMIAEDWYILDEA